MFSFYFPAAYGINDSNNIQPHYQKQNVWPLRQDQLFFQGYQPQNLAFFQGCQPQNRPNFFNVESVLENPLHPIYQDNLFSANYPGSMYPLPLQQNRIDKLLQNFQNQDGTLDFPKMIHTAGQLMGAIQQTTHLIKGIGQMFKV